MIQIRDALSDQMPMVRELFLEYASYLEYELSFQDFAGELSNLPGDYQGPKGCLLLAYYKNQLVGCVAVREWKDKISEMKRLFVKPEFQGLGIGKTLALEIMKRAKDIGYERIRLDTFPSMVSAIKMYEALGFYSIPPYRENPVPGTSYLEKRL